jgi:hypothetical protein
MYQIKKKLQSGELMLGTIISEVRNPNIAYMLAQCGFDFFIIDNEHGTYNYETISVMIAAARGANISVIVRIPEITREKYFETARLWCCRFAGTHGKYRCGSKGSYSACKISAHGKPGRCIAPSA